MIQFKGMSRLMRGVAVAAIALSMTFVGCTSIDNTLGSDLTPEEQNMQIGQMSFSREDVSRRDIFQTRLYRSDSIASSNMPSAYMGATKSDTFGLRKASYFTQFIPGNVLEVDSFGYRPIFDSMVLYLKAVAMEGDTSYVQQFDIYEVIGDKFVYDAKDSILYPNTNIDEYLAEEPIFSFNFPDQANGVYTTSTTVTLQHTPATKQYVDRLMLLDDNSGFTSAIYGDSIEWLKHFKGLYIKPKQAPTGRGAMYATEMESGGLVLYGRSREQADPTIIRDTVGMSYLFIGLDENSDVGNFSYTRVERDLTGSVLGSLESDVVVDDAAFDSKPTVGTIYVEGMGGVATQLTLGEDFFADLDQIIDNTTQETGEIFQSLFFNQAKLKIYLTEDCGGTYDWNAIDPLTITPWLNSMPTRLGLYSDYSLYVGENGYYTLIGIADYNYIYESSSYVDAGYTLEYGGDMNRSTGCYVMNIPSYIQQVWNSYLTAKKSVGGDASKIDWSTVKPRTIYLAPIASDLFTMKSAALQGMDDGVNTAPIALDLTYTLIK